MTKKRPKEKKYGPSSYEHITGSAWLSMGTQSERPGRGRGAARGRGKRHFICPICGTNVPATGTVDRPVCPRCLKPMEPM
ncbi:hypothetical protein JW905_02405 [bacterium]|nr:hypothetical protein [candidate division CSSED10-310 bacterium]